VKEEGWKLIWWEKNVYIPRAIAGCNDGMNVMSARSCRRRTCGSLGSDHVSIDDMGCMARDVAAKSLAFPRSASTRDRL